MDRSPTTASEQLAASALLLLSSIDEPQTIVGDKPDQRATTVQTMLSKSSSSTASILTADASTEEIDRRRFRTSYCSEMRLKVARRNRTKRYFVCKIEHTNMGKAAVTASSASVVSETSCLSVSSEPPCNEEITTNKKKKTVRSGHLWRRAEAILKYLKSEGCASEVTIRQALGDTPDTSKALRILLKLDEIGRSGGGGRSDPYIYKLK